MNKLLKVQLQHSVINRVGYFVLMKLARLSRERCTWHDLAYHRGMKEREKKGRGKGAKEIGGGGTRVCRAYRGHGNYTIPLLSLNHVLTIGYRCNRVLEYNETWFPTDLKVVHGITY